MKCKNRFHLGFWGSLACHAIIAILLAAAGMFDMGRPPDAILEVAIIGGGGGGGAKARAVQAPAAQPRETPPVKPALPDDIVEKKEAIEEKPQPPEPVAQPEPVPADTAAAGSQGGETGEPGDSSGAAGQGSGDGSGSAGEGAGAGNGIGNPAVPPRIIYHREPVYPSSARNREIEGTTMVRLLIGAAGAVEASSVEKSSGSRELDAAAVKALKEWRFVPAKDSFGRSMRCYVYIPVNFHLR